MSEFINNSTQRKEMLRHLLLRLHEGDNPEILRQRLIEVLRSIPYNEVVEVEQELINSNALDAEEILAFCDLHTAVLDGSIDLQGAKEIPAGHPVDTFKKENIAIRQQIETYEKVKKKIADITDAQVPGYVLQLRTIFNNFSDIDKHYKRKEYQQALSITAGHGVWSLGRVQTPTLAMICSRYIENKDFKPEAYFQVKLHTVKDNTVFSAISDERYSTKNDAEAIFERVRSTESISVVKVEQKQVSQESPLLYDLTTLQKEANSRHSLSADKTLSIAQSLYEAKLISYPRTGSRYISEDVFAEVPALIDRLSDHATFGSYARKLSGRDLNRRTVNDKKVTVHHALLITENIPADISKDQRIIYDMIIARMLESFSGKCTKENTTVSLKADGVPFSVKGSVIVIPGWRAVMNAPEESEEDDASVLPVLHQGDVLTNNGVEILEKQTKPRPLHTEASLLSAMETCGKELTDESEREALKESGIGTPATRASIIETLFSREYITREKKSLVPTNKGMVVYLVIKDKKIADVAMTGAWENALNKISNGDMDAASFHKGIEVYAAQITAELLDSKINGGVSEKKSMSCPKCENGQVTFYRKVAKCNNEDCGFILFRNKSGKDLTDGQIEDLISKGKTGVIKGFKSKENKSFDAALTLDSDYKATFVFNNNKKKNKK